MQELFIFNKSKEIVSYEAVFFCGIKNNTDLDTIRIKIGVLCYGQSFTQLLSLLKINKKTLHLHHEFS